MERRIRQWAIILFIYVLITRVIRQRTNKKIDLVTYKCYSISGHSIALSNKKGLHLFTFRKTWNQKLMSEHTFVLLSILIFT